MLCSYECGAKFQKRFFEKHVDKDCPKKIIICPYCDDRHLREDRKVWLTWGMKLVWLHEVWNNIQLIDLFSYVCKLSIVDHVTLSRELFLCLSGNYSFISTWICLNLKEIILKGSITWSTMGQQTNEAKEVYSEKSTKVDAARPKEGIGRRRELLHVLNTNNMATWQTRICTFSFS